MVKCSIVAVAAGVLVLGTIGSAQAAAPHRVAPHHTLTGAHAVKGDLDGDGRSDLVAASYPTIRVYYTSAMPGGSHEQDFAAPGGSVTSLATGDVNGDGYADLIVGAPGIGPTGSSGFPDGGVVVYYGAAAGIDASSGVTLHGGPDGGQFGEHVTAFDYNHDGIDDVLGEAGYSSALWHVYYGGASGVSESNTSTLHVQDVYGMAVGDVNGDGHPDLVLGRPDTGKVKRYSDGDIEGQEGTVAVYYGTRHGYGSTPHVVHGLKAGTGYGNFGTDLAVAKVDGGRYADVIVGAPNWGTGAVSVLYGGKHGLDATHRTVLTPDSAGVPGSGHDADAFGSQIAAGDVTGDGYADAVVGAPQDDNGRYGSVYVFRGGAHGVTTQHSQRLTSSGLGDRGQYPAEFGSTLVTLHDGTRFASIAIGADLYDPSGGTLGDGYGTGFVDVYPGSAGGATTAGAQRIQNTLDTRYFGEALTG